MTALLEPVDSKSELQERLRKCGQSILVGQDQEATKEFFLAHAGSCAIGICSQGHGIKPSILVDKAMDSAWIGYNARIAFVDLRACKMRFQVELDWVFYEILEQMNDGSIVVLHELGACRISRNGQLLWRHSTSDIVVDHVNNPDVLILHTDADEVSIDKERGTLMGR